MHRQLVEKNGLTEGLIYLQITRGAPGDRDFAFPPEDTEPTVVLFTGQADHRKRRPGIVSVEDLRWGRRDIKTSSFTRRWARWRRRRRAATMPGWSGRRGDKHVEQRLYRHRRDRHPARDRGGARARTPLHHQDGGGDQLGEGIWPDRHPCASCTRRHLRWRREKSSPLAGAMGYVGCDDAWMVRGWRGDGWGDTSNNCGYIVTQEVNVAYRWFQGLAGILGCSSSEPATCQQNDHPAQGSQGPRAAVLRGPRGFAREAQMKVEERDLGSLHRWIAEAQDAAEASFVGRTSASAFVMPVVEIDGAPVPPPTATARVRSARSPRACARSTLRKCRASDGRRPRSAMGAWPGLEPS